MKLEKIGLITIEFTEIYIGILPHVVTLLLTKSSCITTLSLVLLYYD